MNLDIFIDKLTAQLQLGDLLLPTTKVSGGLMHHMYKLTTTTGMYALKLLNPKIMQRDNALENFQEADRLERYLETSNLPIVPSLVFNGKKIQEIDGQYFYLYNWYNGIVLKNDNITKLHCQKIGKALSCIHGIDVKDTKLPQMQIAINWDEYLSLAETQNLAVYRLLYTKIDILYKMQDEGNRAMQGLPPIMTICHNDMDCKNVLWTGEDFKIIDLECLCYSSPYLEILELALCWSGYDNCHLDFNLFTAFVVAYLEDSNLPDVDWEYVYCSNYNRLEWLEYNIKRALMIECNSPEEQAIGLEQIEKTLKQIIYYSDIKEDLLRCLAAI